MVMENIMIESCMAEEQHDEGKYFVGNLEIWHRRNMMMENIRIETWESGREGT